MRYLSIQMAPITKVIEAEIKEGKIHIHRSFLVSTSDFINKSEVLNVLKAVTAIASEIKRTGTTTRRILLTCPGIHDVLSEGETQGFLGRDIQSIFQKKKRIEGDEIVYSQSLGSCFFDGEDKSFSLETKMKYDLSTALYRAFKKHGLLLQGIQSETSACLNLHGLMEESYDSSCKIIVDITETEPKSYWLFNDTLALMRTWHGLTHDNLPYLISDYLIRDTGAYHIRNPKIVVVGSATYSYEDILTKLHGCDFDVFDYTDLLAGEEEISPVFSICIALLLQTLYKKRTNLLLTSQRLEEKQLRPLSKGALFLATGLFVFSLASLGSTVYSVLDLNKVSEQRSTLEAELAQSSQEFSMLEARIDKISQVSTQTSKLVDFCQSYPNIYIASVDDRAMLPAVVVEQQTAMDVAVAQMEKNDKKEEEAPPPVEITLPPSLVIRGYAVAAEPISDFYTGLNQSGVFASVQLGGIQRLDEVDVYVFEMEVT